MLQQKQNTSQLQEGDVICIKFRDMTEYVGIYNVPQNPEFAKTVITLSNPYIVHCVSNGSKAQVRLRNKIELEPIYKTTSNDKQFSFDKTSSEILTVFKIDNQFEKQYIDIIKNNKE
ncbi:hypothetical protein PBI_SCTP2_191 [Salicola phage SCTP-2]|nr:hypothetical protein PBI_SCTP2_191 [Salicola phage SCTP-2]